MNVYGPSEIADILKIKIPTLRKYSIMLEERGYNISRNSKNHRYYHDKDIITLRNVIKGSKSGITLDEAISNVLEVHDHNSYTNDTNNTDIANTSDMQELKELIYKQSEIIKEFGERLDKQQQYIDNRLEERDQALMQSINQSLEAQKQIASTKEEEKKGFFKKLFKGN